MRTLLACLLLPGALLPGACGGSGAECAFSDCVDVLELEIGPAEGPIDEAVYEVTVESGGQRLLARCEPASGIAPWQCTEEVGLEDRLTIFDVSVEDDGHLWFRIAGGFGRAEPSEFAVTVTRDGTVVHEDVFTADFGGGNDGDCEGEGYSCASRQERIDL